MSEVKSGWEGRFYEDFSVGDVYQHSLGRTVLDRGPTRQLERTKIRLPDPAVRPGRTVCVDRLHLRTAQEPPAGLHSLVETDRETWPAAYTAAGLRRPSRLEERGSDVVARLQQGTAAAGTHSDGDRRCRFGRTLPALSFHVLPERLRGLGPAGHRVALLWKSAADIRGLLAARSRWRVRGLF